MRKTLIATSALAVAGVMAAGPASAADMLSVGVGGYMEQWFGVANRDDAGADGGIDAQTDAEIHFNGSLETDMGLKVTVHVELEAANDSVTAVDADGKVVKTDETEIDEAFVRVGGEFGQIELGQRDPIHARTHYAAGFGAGAGLNAGDTQNWIPGIYLETAGWTTAGDSRNLIYISPRVNGVQVGLSYGADSTNENSPGGAPANNDNAVWAAGINLVESVGDMSFKVSLGHASVSNPGTVAFNRYNNDTNNANVDVVADDDTVKGFDDRTYTNAGMQIGMSGFTFGASYAARDNGTYMAECWNVNGDVKTLLACPALPEDALDTADNEATGTYGNVDGVAVTDVIAVEDPSGESETWAIGISYSDGPLTVSVDHVAYEEDGGGERTATGVSAGYKLGPGIDWKTSIFGVEDTAHAKGGEGTVFVTGLDIHF